MGKEAVTEKLMNLLKKYRYALLILVLGIVLMLIPGKGEKGTDIAYEPAEKAESVDSVEERLEEILSYINGAGKVEVMLTVCSGAETVYQINENASISDTGEALQKTVVTVTDSERNEAGLVCQIKPPVYLGAIIVCQGGGDPTTRLAIVNAVAGVTGLKTDRISVLEMK